MNKQEEQEENILNQLLRKDVTFDQKKSLRMLAEKEGYDLDEIRGYDDGEWEKMRA